MDIGCYPVNVARMMFDAEPVTVAGVVRRDPSFGTDAPMSAVLDFGGRHATFTVLDRARGRSAGPPHGHRGTAAGRDPVQHPARSADAHHPCRRWFDRRSSPAWRSIEIPPADQYAEQCDAFSAAIRSGEPVPTPPSDAVANMVVLERILASVDRVDISRASSGEGHGVVRPGAGRAAGRRGGWRTGGRWDGARCRAPRVMNRRRASTAAERPGAPPPARPAATRRRLPRRPRCWS